MHPHVALVHSDSTLLSRGHGPVIKKFGVCIQSCGELSAPVPGIRLRDIALIGELLILQGIWVPDVSINVSCCILLRNHKNDIGATAGDP